MRSPKKKKISDNNTYFWLTEAFISFLSHDTKAADFFFFSWHVFFLSCRFFLSKWSLVWNKRRLLTILFFFPSSSQGENHLPFFFPPRRHHIPQVSLGVFFWDESVSNQVCQKRRIHHRLSPLEGRPLDYMRINSSDIKSRCFNCFRSWKTHLGSFTKKSTVRLKQWHNKGY